MRIANDGNVGIGTDSPGDYDGEADDLVVFNSTTPGITIATDTTTSRGSILFSDGTTGDQKYRGGVIYDHGTGMGGIADTMYIRAAVSSYLVWTAAGQLGIGLINPANYNVNGDNLVIEDAGNVGMTIATTDGGDSNIFFADGNSGADEYRGILRYAHSNDSMQIYTDATLNTTFLGTTLTCVGDIVAYSDKKLKKNIKTLDGSKVYKMRGVSFDRIDTGESSSGIIAQEIQEIAPELISESNETLGVAYGNLTGYLIEAIKELKAEIEELKSKPCVCNNCNCKSS